MKSHKLLILLFALSVSRAHSQKGDQQKTEAPPSNNPAAKAALGASPDVDACCLSDAMTKTPMALGHQNIVNTIFKTLNVKKEAGPWRSFSTRSKKDFQALQVQIFKAEEKGGIESVFALVNGLLKSGKQHPDMVKHAFASYITHSAKARLYLTVPDLKEWAFFKKFQDAGIAAVANSKSASDANAAGAQLIKPITADTFTGEEILAYWRDDYDYQDHHLHWHVVYPGAGIYNSATKTSSPVIDRQGELFLYMHSQMVSRYDAERLSWGDAGDGHL